jgi:hypothetical protein
VIRKGKKMSRSGGDKVSLRHPCMDLPPFVGEKSYLIKILLEIVSKPEGVMG